MLEYNNEQIIALAKSLNIFMEITKFSVIAVLLTLTTIIFSGCGKKEESASSPSSSSSLGSTGYTRQIMPAKTTVNLPSTLTSKASSSSSRTAYASMTASLGAGQAQSSVMMLKYMLVNVELNMIIMDAAISQSAMSVGNCYAANEVTVTFTEEMLQSLKDVYSKIDSEMSSSDLSKYSALVDTQISNDDYAVSYVTTTK